MFRKDSLRICVIFILALLLRLGLSVALNDIYNTANMRTIAMLALKGNPFSLALNQSTDFGLIDWPYPPLCILFLLPPTLIYQATGSELLFQLTFKTPLILADLVTAALIYYYCMAPCAGPTRQSAHTVAALFLFNPAVLLSSSTGRWESLSITFSMASFWLLICRNRFDLSAIMLGLAIAIRGYPILLVPLFCIYVWRRGGWKEGLRYAFLALIPLALSAIPFIIADISAFFGVIAKEQATPGPLSSFVVLNFVLHPLGLKSGILAMVLIGILLWRLSVLYTNYAQRGGSLLGLSLLTLLLLFVYYPKVHYDYLISLLPFALLSKNLWARLAWLPGFLWALLLNGTRGATGFFYWTAWRTGLYVATWQYLGLASSILFPITLLLITFQVVLLILAMREIPFHRAHLRATYIETVVGKVANGVATRDARD